MFSHLRNDLPASVVVFFVAVPLCLGIALASGAPLFSGLIAGIVGGLVVGALSGSPLGVSGPAAGLAVIVLSAIDDLGFEVFLLAVVISGAIQIVMGLLRAGVLGYFFPTSVIRGMLAGIGIIIVLKQIPHAFGYDADPVGDVSFHQPDGETTLSEFVRMLDAVQWNAALVALVALIILIGWERWLAGRARIFQLVQGPLAAVAFGIGYQVLTTRFAPHLAISAEHLVSVPVSDGFAGFVTLFSGPDWSGVTNPSVWIAAVTIATVGSLETLLCVEATDKLDPHKRVTPTNRELLAQGAGNMLSGAIGGLPITQVIVRSSANIQSGARSKLSAILHGALLFVSVLFLPQVLNLVPLSVLASILFVVGFKLAKPALFHSVYRQGASQFVPFVVTIVGIVFTDLLTGIALGMVVAILALLRRSYQNSIFLHMSEGDVANNHFVKMRLAEEVTFLNRGAILRELTAIPARSHVTIDLSGCVSIDHDVREILRDFAENAKDRDLTVEFKKSERDSKRASKQLQSA